MHDRILDLTVPENEQTVGDVCAGIRREFDKLREEIKFLTMERDAARAESKQFEDALKRVLDAADRRDAEAEYGVVEELYEEDDSGVVTAVRVRFPVGTRVATKRIE